ncbi:sialate O-acetylesterase [Dyadobacter koreensis]|uniref:Sialate O-acetylesterase n=1 Tax=Dyadobacter koreensis TaxID=408657 RepID=A0A1H6QR34_9BACT|nr:sialate O-acetylesterase [Dyadobacter koreensis]SEI43434.1 sialate O-acetylesterase [Dyadobacter koreensis]
MKKIFLFLLLISGTSSFAQLKLARLFSDHVVLQRQKQIPVWGWAKPKETVTVTLAGQTLKAKADASGKWLVRFSPLEAGGPYQMNVSGSSGKVSVEDILIGEVWLCSGQSNMEFKVQQADNFSEEKKNADFPKIRHFNVDHEVTMDVQKDLKNGSWQIASPETVGNFTAIGFFFARELFQKLNVPIGILHSSWGGSQIEGWISKEGMLSSEELKNYANNLPKSWKEADSQLDRKLRKQLFKDSQINPSAEDEAKYQEPGYDFSKWTKTDNPIGQWDWKGIWAFRGNGYMARTIFVPADLVARKTVLGLAENDSHNAIFINGKLIKEGILKGVRKIEIPENIWRAGDNSLVIKFGNMIDTPWYGLGLRGSSDDLYVGTDKQKISIAKDWFLMPSFADNHSYVHSSNNVGTTIYNAMIAPLVPFAIRGNLWYQGEANTGRAFQYRQSFPLMIHDWRNKWAVNGKPGDESFYFVQLSSYGPDQDSNKGSSWAELREAQTMTLELPKTGMAVTTDVGNAKDIHPTNKQDVAHRLATNALKLDYGQNIEYSSPLYDTVTFSEGKATISFKFAGSGLVVKDKYGYLKGFEIAGEDRIFYYAKAEILGNTVIVYHPKGVKPTSVRYAWSDAPVEANLYNSEDFPASPFRTDNWPGITIGKKFE